MENGTSAPQAGAPNTSSQNESSPQTGQQNTPPSSNSSQTGKSSKSGQNGSPASGGAQPTSQNEYFDVKVNGKVIRMSRQEAIDLASMSHAANSKFDEASKIRKSVDHIITTAKTNPIQALMDPALGLTKDQIRDAFETWYHKEYIESESLTPDQKRAQALEAKLKAYEDAEADKVKKQREQEESDLTNKQREYLQGQIIDAIERSGLPKSKWLASRMAFYMRENLTKGWDAPLDLIVKQVKNERQSIMSDLTDNSEGDTLISLLGEGVVNKIRQYDLKRLRDQRASKAPDFSKSSRSQSDQRSSSRISSSEVNQRLKDLRTGKKSF